MSATNQLLAEVGYSALTIEGVAARAGVGKATVYRWWPSKGALTIEALVDNRSAPPTQDTANLRADLIDALDRVITLLTTSTEGTIIAALTADLVSDPALAEAFRTQILRPRRTEVAAMLERAVRRGDLASDIDISLVLDACVGAVFYRLILSGEPLTGDIAEHVVDLILDGAQP